MKKRVIQFLTLCLVTTFTFSFSAGQTLPGIHLGELEFQQATNNLSRQKKMLKETMSPRGITSLFTLKVGGVAFVQVAQPSFKIESFSLQCDPDNNSAYAIINGHRHSIPLETWQLMPIVEYANSNDHAVVTLFGTEECGTLFHNAFIDKLLGLRLLQTDLLLAGKYLQKDHRGELPTFNGSETPILAESEKMLYNPHVFVASSLKASKNIDSLKKSLGEYYTSYVFTDFVDSVTGDSIKFNVMDDSLVIEGFPYYYFIRTDTTQIDTLEILCNFFDGLKSNKKALDTFKQNTSSKSYKIRSKINKGDFQGALDLFYKSYKGIDSSKSVYNFQRKIEILNDSLNQPYRCSLKSLAENKQLFDEIKELEERIETGKPDIYDFVLLSENLKKRMKLDGKTTDKLNFPTFDDLLIFYFYQNPIPKIIRLTELTNALREKHELVRELNPIVIDAAVSTCQWAAFFRYAKKYHKKNWNTFVKQVKSLQYDAPAVYTPVNNLKNKSDEQ